MDEDDDVSVFDRPVQIRQKYSTISRVSGMSNFSRRSQKAAHKAEIQSAFRVIAPYATFGIKEEIAGENESFRFYLQQKPEILLADYSHYLDDTIDLFLVLKDSVRTLKVTTEATGANLYLADETGKEIYLCREKTHNKRHRLRWGIRKGTIVAAHVACTLDYVYLKEIGLDTRFPGGVPYNPLAKSVICCPILTSEKDCYAVVELYKTNEPAFNEDNLEFVLMLTAWISATIHQNLSRIIQEKRRVLNNYLLNLTKCYFADPALLATTIGEIVNFARLILFAKCASFVVFDDKHENGNISSHVYNEEGDISQKLTQVILNRENGVLEYVAKTGKIVNIRDATSDRRWSNDDQISRPELVVRAVLCMPVTSNGQMKGIVQIKNKKGGGYFNFFDELLCKAFVEFCDLALHFAATRQQKRKNELCTKIFARLFTSHINPCVHDLSRFRDSPFAKIPLGFNTFHWYIPKDLKHKMPQFILYMLVKVIGSSEIILENAVKFILSVQKSYVDNPYCNFENAFNAMHFVYLVLLHNADKFTFAEKKGLLIGSLCYCVGHQMCNDSITIIHDEKFLLHEAYDRENYHYFVTERILNSSKIFRYLTPASYEKILVEVKSAILATNAYKRTKLLKTLTKIVKQQRFSWSDSVHRVYLKNLVMAVSLTSFCWKAFTIMKNMLENYFEEQFRRAACCKLEGKTPEPATDQSFYAKTAQQTTQLLRNVFMPMFELLKALLPDTIDFSYTADAIVRYWSDYLM